MSDTDIETLITTLRALPLFAELPREDLARLVGGLEEVSVPAGGIVYAQGEPGDAMYIVASGALEVRFGEEGWEERVRATGPGEWFGEMALLTGDPRSATVVALSDSRLWRLDKDRFLVLSDQHPALLREITRVLCRRLATSAGKVGRARHAYAQAFEDVFATCGPDERRILFRVALATRPDPAVLEALPGCVSACEHLDAFTKRHPALLRHGEGGICVIHPQFREYVLEGLQREEGPEAVLQLHRDLAGIFEKRGEWQEAIAHRESAQEWSEAVRLLRRALTDPKPPVDMDLGTLLDRLPESIVLAEPDLLRAKASLLTRLGEGEAAVALYQRALAAAPAGGAVREVLLRALADQYVAQGKVEQALACLREGAGSEGGEAAESAALQEAVAARYLAAGRGAEAYALARSARALSRGLRDTMASHLRRLWLVQGWHGLGLALAAGGLVLAFPPTGLSPQAVRLLATLAAAAVLWVGGQPPDFVVALGMGMAWVLLGVAPARTAFAGFASSTWFLILGIFAVGAALGRSGLLYRVTLHILRRCPPTFGGQVLALGLAGVASTLLVPSVQGRVALVGPMLVGVCEGLGYPPRSRESAGLAFASLLGFGLATTLFLTGTATVLMAWGMLPAVTRLQMTWGHWFVGVLPLEILIFLGAIGWIVWRYAPAEQMRPAHRGAVGAQLAALGPVSREERTTGLVTAGMLLGWLTQGFHGVDAAWIALAGLCALLGAGILDRQSVRADVDWPFLLFMGMVISLAELTVQVGADAWLADAVHPILGGAAHHKAGAVTAAVLITVAVRFLLPWQTAVPLLTVALTPFAQEAGVSPWIMALIALKAGNIFLLPYMNAYYLTLYYGTEENAFTHAQARPFAWAYIAIVLAAFLLSLPYWHLLGLA